MAESKKLSFETIMTVLMEKSDDERKKFIEDHQASIKSVIKLVCRLIITGDKTEKINSLTCLAKISEVEDNLILTNLLEDTAVYEAILKPIVNFIHNRDHPEADSEQVDVIKYSLIILVNITRQKNCVKIFHSLLDTNKLLSSFHTILSNVVMISATDKFEPLIIELVFNLLLNLSQPSLILDEIQKNQDNLALLMKDLLNFFEKSTCTKIRVCCISIIVNFLIHGSAQTTLLDSKSELITKILYPLAGPTEVEFDDEDMAQLPLDLQYLPPDKEREADNNVRDALISCLLLCCNTRKGRDSLKDHGTYYILRELHKQEKDRSIQKRVEDVVDILTKEEEEYNQFPDLMSTAIPEHLIGKFDEMDQTLLNE
ncbi:protein HGH1 homolog [Tetranychus urticae]|uniref:Protein HGH1 homolog n=1 Tax=Tetranychus urticae TaxID=32264 RepID=T1KTU1_TETUR|nr:protein HGH1 homolog [Tetranychus urticae]